MPSLFPRFASQSGKREVEIAAVFNFVLTGNQMGTSIEQCHLKRMLSSTGCQSWCSFDQQDMIYNLCAVTLEICLLSWMPSCMGMDLGVADKVVKGPQI